MNYSDPRKFGHYTVGTHQVFSKVEALELSARLNQAVQYHYNDEVFSQCDWVTEPPLTLADYYRQRAAQLRRQYDYLVIFYSGGADSHNMLESFVSAGVFPDEIVSFHSYGADADRASSFNREVFETAVPYVERLRQTGRLPASVPHRLIDMSTVIQQFGQDIDWREFEYYFSSSVSINNVARSRLRHYVQDWRSRIDAGITVGLVWGHDKPRIMHINGQFCLQFMDLFDNCASVFNQQYVTAGYFDEMFYSTPDMPELVVKQAHTIKNFLQTAPADHPYLTSRVTGLGHVMKSVDGLPSARWLTQDAQSHLIYPWFNDQLYYESKPLDIITSKRDAWFWKDQELSQGFFRSIDSITQRLGTEWLNVSTTGRATKNFRTRPYPIGQ
jgi:hypothetical protein